MVEGGAAGWVEVEGGGYWLSLVEGSLVCRNARGKVLASVPPAVRQSAQGHQLLALKEWLEGHAAACLSQAEGWMLRSLPVSRAAVAAVWPDPAQRRALEDLVVAAVEPGGEIDQGAAGLLRGVDAERGLGVVTLDGETAWLSGAHVAIPHPILLDDLEDWRQLAGELGVSQAVGQLFRETWSRPADVDGAAARTDVWGEGRFAQLVHAMGRCQSLGYRVKGGYATIEILEGGQLVEARYWIGSEAPTEETLTGELAWVDGRGRAMSLGSVGPVAWSEGNRMASRVYAGRVVEKKAGEVG